MFHTTQIAFPACRSQALTTETSEAEAEAYSQTDALTTCKCIASALGTCVFGTHDFDLEHFVSAALH